MMEERCVSVSWSNTPASKYEVSLIIYSNTNENHLADIIQQTSRLNVNVDGVKVVSKDQYNVYQMEAYVKNKEHLEKLMQELKKEPYIVNVERLIQ